MRARWDPNPPDLSRTPALCEPWRLQPRPIKNRQKALNPKLNLNCDACQVGPQPAGPVPHAGAVRALAPAAAADRKGAKALILN